MALEVGAALMHSVVGAAMAARFAFVVILQPDLASLQLAFVVEEAALLVGPPRHPKMHMQLHAAPRVMVQHRAVLQDVVEETEVALASCRSGKLEVVQLEVALASRRSGKLEVVQLEVALASLLSLPRF